MAGQPENSPRAHRAEEALEALAQRSRESAGTRLRRVRLTALPIVQSAVGAALAWWLATLPPIDHTQPFFAPIAALIVLGGGLGQRLPRVLELVGGVALGVLVGDLLVAWIGAGVVQIGVVVTLAMVVAVLVGGGPLIVTQAAASAVLVVAFVPPSDGTVINLDRFVDALVGGVVGLVISVVLLPLNPVSAARRQIDPLLTTLAELLEESAQALVGRDRAAATKALERARDTQADVDDMHSAMEGANEVARIAPVRWRERGHLGAYVDVAVPVDHMTRNVRVLCRHVISILQRNEPVPQEVPQSLRALAGALRLLRIDLDRGDEPRESRLSAVAAAQMATEALDHTGGFAGQVVIAQVRSLAVDALLATGLSRDEVQELLPGLPEGPVSYG
ncbi:FUSC family protein [Jiangella gansuensis]|uniref:FUSC family protein n=1 Tax=Jiangella gansuensis TaxID=281473 RepID=UPI0004B307C1|nr:FUSC family protein [Jiangella gansuensis]